MAPPLASEMGAAMVRGLQGDPLPGARKRPPDRRALGPPSVATMQRMRGFRTHFQTGSNTTICLLR